MLLDVYGLARFRGRVCTDAHLSEAVVFFPA